MLFTTVKFRKFTLASIVLIIVTSLILSSSLSGIGSMNQEGAINHSLTSSSTMVTGHYSSQSLISNTPSIYKESTSVAKNYIPSLISPMQSIGSFGVRNNSATLYSINFVATNKVSGLDWSVYVYTNLSLAIPDLPLYNALNHESYGVVFSGSSTSSTISGSIPSGTYYYYAGPTSALTGPYEIIVSGTQSVTVTFPVSYTASFTETGLGAGASWSVYGTATLPNDKMTILSETATTSTISVSAPNGYYSFAYGVGSTVIESYPFLISGSNVTRQISIPSFHAITFQESGLSTGVQWQIFGETLTNNQYSLNNFFTIDSTSNSATVEVPNGVYFYEPSTGQTTLSSSTSIYVEGVNQTISVDFPVMYAVVFDGVGYRSGIGWQVSTYSTDGKFSSTVYSTSSTQRLELPNDNYTYAAGEGGSNFIRGTFSVSSSNYSSTITFPQTYLLNFSETGLASGMGWGVTVYGANHTTAFSNTTIGTRISIYLPAGKYDYSVSENPFATVLYQQDQSVYSSSSFTIGNSQLNLSVAFPNLVPVTFNESNLRAGIAWGVGAYSSSSPTGFSEIFYNTSSVYDSVKLYLINGTFSYSVEEAGAYIYPSVSAFNVTGSQLTEVYNFPSLYSISFSIIGLKTSTTWSLTVDESNYSVIYYNSSAASSVLAYLPNGSYNYSVTTTSHISASSSFSVSGTGLTVPVTITSSYSVTFIETGLPSGTLWYLSVNGVYSFSSNNTIQISEPNGTYQYSIISSSYTASPSNGTLVIAGKDLSIAVIFKQTEATYPVTFSETGLTNGTVWSVTISNSTENSVHSSITLQEPNGTYTYEINASGFTPSPSAGLVLVSGAGQTISIAFIPTKPVPKYSITFSEAGLSTNKEWTVSLTNSTNAGKVVNVISTVKGNIDVYGITYDSSNRYLYASGVERNSTSASNYPGVVLVISPITNTVINTISVGSLPESSVYDPFNGYLYVANALSNNVSVINTVTQSVIATISVGNQPVGIAYSSVNNDVYVANGASGTVSVISSAYNAVLSTIVLGSSGQTLAGAVFDPSNGNLYVGGFNNVSKTDRVFVIDTLTNVVATEINGAAYFGAYDSLNGYIYFTDNSLNSVLVVDGSTNKVVTIIDLPSHSSPIGLTYDSYDHNIYVAEQNSSSLAVISSLTNTVIASLDVTGSPLFPTYVPSNHDIYVSNHLVGGIQEVSSYGGVSSVKSSTVDTLQFSEPNGSYSYSIGSINGYTVNPQSGFLTVQGSSINESVSFSVVVGYEVTFSQIGLRAGVSWSVTLGASTQQSTSPSVTFTEINGTYSFRITNVSGYVVSPTTGVITVSGSSITKSITFSEVFTVNFVESNLPAGTTWTVTLAGVAKSSGTNTITFGELNGSYSYSVNSSKNYTASPSSGTIVVNGATLNQTVQFSPVQVPLFLTGTISPTNATLYINGQPVSTVNGVFNVSVNPGSYDIKVVLGGYVTYYHNVTVTSNQTKISALTITLAKVTPPSPLSTIDIVIIAVVVIAVVAAISVSIVRLRKRA